MEYTAGAAANIVVIADAAVFGARHVHALGVEQIQGNDFAAAVALDLRIGIAA